MPVRPIGPAEQIVSFREALGQRVSLREVEETLENLDLTDDEQVMRAVRRCNNRCKGNRISVAVQDQGSGREFTFAARLTD